MEPDDLRDARFVWWPNSPLPHHTTLADFTAQPPVVFQPYARHAALPARLPSALASMPFLVGGYTLHVGSTWEILTVQGSEQPIAIYRETYALRVGADAPRKQGWDAQAAPGEVESPHRRKGLGVMMFVWRCERRGQPPANHPVKRSTASWQLRKKGHRILLERALARGSLVPEHVLADYPDLKGVKQDGDHHDHNRSRSTEFERRP